MPKTWVVARDIAGNGTTTETTTFLRPKVTDPARFQKRAVCLVPRTRYIYTCIYVHGHDFDFRGVRILGWNLFKVIDVVAACRRFRKDSYGTNVSEFLSYFC